MPRPADQPKRPAPSRSGRMLLWAMVGLLAALSAVAFFFLRARQNVFFRAALRTEIASVGMDLQRHTELFSLEEMDQLNRLLAELDAFLAAQDLDARAAGHVRFLLAVLREVAREGRLQAGELNKLQDQFTVVKRYQQKRTPAPRAAPTP